MRSNAMLSILGLYGYDSTIFDSMELPESIDNIVYCLVSSMRKKIEPELKQCRYIKTVRGVGYKFEGKKMDIFPE